MLLKKIARQDKLAFEQLYPVLKPNLSRFLLWKFNRLDEYEVEGIVQQTLEKVWEKANTYSGQTDISAKNWIVAIAKNLAIDYLNQRRRQVGFEEASEGWLAEHALHVAHSNNPLEDLTIQNEKFRQLKKSLTLREKQVFELLIEGHPQKSIARMLRITPPRVNQLIVAIERKIRSNKM